MTLIFVGLNGEGNSFNYKKFSTKSGKERNYFFLACAFIKEFEVDAMPAGKFLDTIVSGLPVLKK